MKAQPQRELPRFEVREVAGSDHFPPAETRPAEIFSGSPPQTHLQTRD